MTPNDIFAGGGSLRARMMEVDWQGTPLGCVGSWSQGLLTSLSICLGSRFPSAIFWGPELALLYNDAYVPALGKRHPSSLGQPALRVWPELGERIEALLRRVIETGERASSDLMLPLRPEQMQHSFFTFTYSPIRATSREIDGVFCAAQPKEDAVAVASLHRLGSMFFSKPLTIEPLLLEVVDLAMAITGSDFGNVQLLDPATADLRIVAQRGFEQWWLDFWNAVSAGQGTCGTALERGERIVVEDVERSPIFVGTPSLEVQRRAGVRAVVSTPLVSRSGKLFGMFSTHFRAPRRFDGQVLHRLDLLARQAGDIVERAMAEEALRQSEQRARALAEERGQLVERLEESVRFAEQFVGILGHDLRNPLSAIRASAEVLSVSERPASQKKAIHRILSSSDQMTNMVGQLLDLTRSRLAGGIVVERQSTAFDHIISDVNGNFRRRPPEASISSGTRTTLRGI